ncbi:beta-glucoside-specific PTS transporter subunit IIABC [Enemella sp. A6]|uniref:beta-glucoside-specific PTS transporter subunit IIABC n=1 Tax=Enemella sp. A6 TaxID=3440152 RepID=UPI003EBF3619
MVKVDYQSLAGEILREVGGEENIAQATHCATRLRLRLRDESKADKAAVEKLPGVITVMPAGGQFQVVIGNNVPQTYQELMRITKLGEADDTEAETGPKGNLLSQFIDLITAILHPILWTLAGAGLLKAFLALATTFGWLSPEGTTYAIWNAASDGLFYFLPMLLAVGASKKFHANTATSLAIAGAMVYPAIVAMVGNPDVTFFGIPVIAANYTSSLIPIIVAVWLQGHLERLLNKVLPATIRNFTTPLLVLTLLVPFVLMTVGPLTTYLANGISGGVQWLFEVAPWAGGAIMGAAWQIFVIFGLHWAFVPIMLNDLSTVGHTLLGGPVLPAVLAQAAAMLAVMVRTKSKSLRQIAGPAALSGFLAGVTEPGIYGVNLPKKRPFIYGCIGGAVGGVIVALAGGANDAFVFPSLIGIPAYMNVGNFAMTMVGVAVAVVIAFTLTLVLGFPDAPDEEVAADITNPALTAPVSTPVDAGAPVTGTGTTLLATDSLDVRAPVPGKAVALTEVNDKVFASGAMGAGMGIVPTSGDLVAPISGEVRAAMPHAYGIKSDNGVEVLVHIGIDTVQLDGQGFTSHVTQGQRVEAGDKLATVDLTTITEAGYDPTTVVIVTNSAQLTEVVPVTDGDLDADDLALAIKL